MFEPKIFESLIEGEMLSENKFQIF